MYVSREFPIYYQHEDSLTSINNAIDNAKKRIEELRNKVHQYNNVVAKTEFSDAVNKHMDLQSLLVKHLEQDPRKKLESIWDDIDLSLKTYQHHCSLRFLSPAQERTASIQRLLAFGRKIMNSTADASTRLSDLLGLLLYEITVTENHHNKNWYSHYSTVSFLADNYMQVYRNNGIDLNRPDINRVHEALLKVGPEAYFKSYDDAPQPVTMESSTKNILQHAKRKKTRNAIIDSIGSFETKQDSSIDIAEENTKKQVPLPAPMLAPIPKTITLETLRGNIETHDTEIKTPTLSN